MARLSIIGKREVIRQSLDVVKYKSTLHSQPIFNSNDENGIAK